MVEREQIEMDVVFVGAGPANLAAFRRLALNVLRSDPENIPLSHKRLKARWANDDLLKLMTHMR